MAGAQAVQFALAPLFWRPVQETWAAAFSIYPLVAPQTTPFRKLIPLTQRRSRRKIDSDGQAWPKKGGEAFLGLCSRRKFIQKTAFCVSQVTVGGTVTHPAADSEPDVSVSPHPAPQYGGPCQWYNLAWAWS